MQDEFNHMLQLGIRRPSESAWTSALHMVPNNRPGDVPKTAITMPFGLFDLLRTHFGLRNASQTFQRFIDAVMHGVDFVFVCIDDVLIMSSDESEHLRHLETVFQRLADNGLVVNTHKCHFGQPLVEYLGHVIDAEGYRPLPEKVRTATKFPPPTSKRQLRRFLGMINFYRRFIPGCATLAAPRNSLTAGKTHGPNTLSVEDAPTTAAGAVLHQQRGTGQQSLAFLFKAFYPTLQTLRGGVARGGFNRPSAVGVGPAKSFQPAHGTRDSAA